MDLLIENASLLQAVMLLCALSAVMFWERVLPLLEDHGTDASRPAGNFGLLLINQALPYLLVPISTAISAWAAAHLGYGLLRTLDLPWGVGALLSFVALDATAWWVHRAMHSHAWLWRVHRVHHSDLQFDCSLAFRFHPLEATLQALAATVVVMLLGLPVEGVVIAGLLAAAHNVFVHANATLGARTEHLLRALMVTPDLHRVHHALDMDCSMSNFGITLSWWDRLTGHYRLPVGHGVAPFGLAEDRAPGRLTLTRLLAMPLRRPQTEAP